VIPLPPPGAQTKALPATEVSPFKAAPLEHDTGQESLW
jgi:hypothetical protein